MTEFEDHFSGFGRVHSANCPMPHNFWSQYTDKSLKLQFAYLLHKALSMYLYEAVWLLLSAYKNDVRADVGSP